MAVDVAASGADGRRQEMLAAAAELIAERGYASTRIADVARRIGASPALVIYYFGTKDHLLSEALRFSEQAFYSAAESMLEQESRLQDRLETLVRWTCVPQRAGEIPGAWGLWFDLWATAFRVPEVARDRIELDVRWRALISRVVADGVAAGDIDPVDADDFAVTFASLLDGLSIQVALNDPVVDPERATAIAMSFAARALGALWDPRRRVPSRPRR